MTIHRHWAMFQRKNRTKSKEGKRVVFLRVGIVSSIPDVAVVLQRRLALNDKVAGGRHVSSLQAWTLNAAIVGLRRTRVPFGADPINAILPS
mgnify:CR=1 FL=1